MIQVTWNGPNDTGNPKNWSIKTKIACTLTISMTGLASIMMSSMMAPALPLVGTELHMDTFVQPEMALSVYVLAIAFRPAGVKSALRAIRACANLALGECLV